MIIGIQDLFLYCSRGHQARNVGLLEKPFFYARIIIYLAFLGPENPCQKLQQGGLTLTVLPHNTDPVALCYGKR